MWDRSFVFDVYVLTTKNINLFSLERKNFDVKKREIINMSWEDCNEPSFYKHICKPDNFLYLNSKNKIYPCVADIFWKCLEQYKQNLDKIRKKFIENKKVFSLSISASILKSTAFLKSEAQI